MRPVSEMVFVCYDASGIPVELIFDDGMPTTSHDALQYVRSGGRIDRVPLEEARSIELYRSKP